MTLGDGWPPFYADRKSSADVDINQLYIVFVVGALTCGLLLILPGVRGVERSYFVLRWTVTLLIGALIVACGQGLCWQVAEVTADLRYTVAKENVTKFNVGLWIGLTQFNVTLKGDLTPGKNSLNLNEKFIFLNTDNMVEEALTRGIPFPILTVAEHFSSTRFHALWQWGRKYWMAGHYGSYLLWTSLACWLLTNMLFRMTLQHGSVFMILTGLLLLSANISFATVNVGETLSITIGYQDPPSRLTVHYGWCFWASLTMGLACVILGVVAFALERTRKVYLEKFFMLQGEEDDVVFSSMSTSYVSQVGSPTPTRGILRSSATSTKDGSENSSFVHETVDEVTQTKKQRNRVVSIALEEKTTSVSVKNNNQSEQKVTKM